MITTAAYITSDIILLYYFADRTINKILREILLTLNDAESHRSHLVELFNLHNTCLIPDH